MVFIFFFFMLFGSCNSLSMDTLEMKYSKEEFNAWFKELGGQAMLELKEEDRKAIMPNFYKNNIEQGHQAVRAFAQNIVGLVQQKKSICFDNEATISFQLADHIIDLRDISLGLKAAEVVDEMTARAYATSLLSDQERNLLQRGTYNTNKEKALVVFKKLAELAYEQLVIKNLQGTRTENDYVTDFIQEKINAFEMFYEN